MHYIVLGNDPLIGRVTFACEAESPEAALLLAVSSEGWEPAFAVEPPQRRVTAGSVVEVDHAEHPRQRWEVDMVSATQAVLCGADRTDRTPVELARQGDEPPPVMRLIITTEQYEMLLNTVSDAARMADEERQYAESMVTQDPTPTPLEETVAASAARDAERLDTLFAWLQRQGDRQQQPVRRAN